MSRSKLSFPFSGGYSELIEGAGLAEHAAVRGCMVFKPYGFALWENIRDVLDRKLKERGQVNAYFPLLIPSSYLGKEARHVRGFAKECAVVTHYRVRCDGDGEVVPDPGALLQEPLVIRPTSEAIVWPSFKRWITSYRDLPLRVNQWANVLRWEMRPRLFLRTAEILWQEGHTAHASAEEAREESVGMVDLYADFMRDYLAIPVVRGEKSEHERFSGAVGTYTLEGLMQDGKALQLGTSHFLGQHFARAFGVRFADKGGGQVHVWGSSWGVTTRLIGAMVMVHADAKGLVLPPRVAPCQVVIVPIYRKSEDGGDVVGRYVDRVYEVLKRGGVRVDVDDREVYRPGWKFAAHELRGVPLRVVVGVREAMGEEVTLVRRDTHASMVVGVDGLVGVVEGVLGSIQGGLYDRAVSFMEGHTFEVDDYGDFKEVIGGRCGWVLAHWDGSKATEEQIHRETNASIRCIPLGGGVEEGRCICSGRRSRRRVLFAQAY